MPFDGNPEDFADSKSRIFSLEGLIAWLETQDPATEYDYSDCFGMCLIGQYLAARGVPWEEERYGDFLTLPARVTIASGCSAPFGETYGAALDRARALQQGRA